MAKLILAYVYTGVLAENADKLHSDSDNQTKGGFVTQLCAVDVAQKAASKGDIALARMIVSDALTIVQLLLVGVDVELMLNYSDQITIERVLRQLPSDVNTTMLMLVLEKCDPSAYAQLLTYAATKGLVALVKQLMKKVHDRGH
ncbi:unnamed protein product [Phytophthora lilii]|uniref:Unnamed protein product n=1 Tax=Phytophthora lilii TaxID=2077276 RepID=A0A9W6TSZ0_9STRA|nr:unnamed protein product [Phytophthora lilii]